MIPTATFEPGTDYLIISSKVSDDNEVAFHGRLKGVDVIPFLKKRFNEYSDCTPVHVVKVIGTFRPVTIVEEVL